MDILLNLDFKKVIFFILKFIFIALLTFLAFRASVYFLPFIIAFIIALVVEPIIKFLCTKLKFSRKISALFCLVSIFSLLGLLLSFGISKIVSELSNLSKLIPQYSIIVTSNIEKFISQATDFYLALPTGVTSSIEDLLLEISNSLSTSIDFILKKTLSTAISLPNTLVFILVTIVSTYFFISDKKLVSDTLTNLIPKKLMKVIRLIKTESFSATGAYIRSQLIMASITTIQIVLGFSILRVENILILSISLFFLDLLPMVGVGSLLIPWGIYEFIFDSTYQGFGLLLLYVSILIVRNLIEPKILSSQIGLHPLLILMAMYVGLEVFGVFGLILGPLLTILIKNVLTELFKSCSAKDIKNWLITNLCKN